MNTTAPDQDHDADGRRQPRTHLFVIATLTADSISSPVHIRNMSASGALLESGNLPDVGSRFLLKRGSLRVTGILAWKAGRKAGARFDSPIYVADWMSQKGSVQQGQVDAVVHSVKAGSSAANSSEPAPETVELELMMVRADLLALGNALIGDTILVATHPEIQTLDIALQRIDRVIQKLHKERTALAAG